jgi:hypothetical protein
MGKLEIDINRTQAQEYLS